MKNASFLLTLFLFFSTFSHATPLIFRIHPLSQSFELKPGCYEKTILPPNDRSRVIFEYRCSTSDAHSEIIFAREGCTIFPGPKASGYTLLQNDCKVTVTSSITPSTANVFAHRPLSNNYLSYSADGILDKPVILVEGFDAGNQTLPKYYYDSGFNQLVYGGRDLFIVNFSNSTAALNDNAALLQGIIQEINNAKTGSHPLAVIGYSMGGVIAKKALKNMETAGIDHKTSVYVSYDAPHLGSNLPHSLIYFVDHLTGKLNKYHQDIPHYLRLAKNAYSSPAAKEMVIRDNNFPSAPFESFPKNLSRIAITSGNVSGQIQSNPTSLDELIAQFRIGAEWDLEFTTATKSYTYRFISQDVNGKFIDNAPGSYNNIFHATLAQIESASDNNRNFVYNLQASAELKDVTFIPTLSSLAIEGFPMSSSAVDNFSKYSPFDKYIAADGTWSCNMQNKNTYSNLSLRPEDSRNIPHGNFDYSQLAQLKCALNEYHKIGFSIPDRSHKKDFVSPTSCGPHSGKLYASNVTQSEMPYATTGAKQVCGSCGLNVTQNPSGTYSISCK